MYFIFGYKGVTTTKGQGEFYCPRCGGKKQPYTHQLVRRFFTVYFIPLIPMEKLNEYVECQRCGGAFSERALSFDPAEHAAELQAAYLEHLKRVLVLAALTDGVVDDREAEIIRAVYEHHSSLRLDKDALRREIMLARNSEMTPASYVETIKDQLDDPGKETLIKAFFSVTAHDGVLSDRDAKSLDQMAAALKLSPAHLRGILAEMEELPGQPS